MQPQLTLDPTIEPLTSPQTTLIYTLHTVSLSLSLSLSLNLFSFSFTVCMCVCVCVGCVCMYLSLLSKENSAGTETCKCRATFFSLSIEHEEGRRRGKKVPGEGVMSGSSPCFQVSCILFFYFPPPHRNKGKEALNARMKLVKGSLDFNRCTALIQFTYHV